MAPTCLDRISSPTIVAADDGARLAGVLAGLHVDDGRHVVVVTDRPDALSNRTGVLRRFLAVEPSIAVVAVVRPDGVVPPLCRGELRIGSRCIGRWCPDLATIASVPSSAAGISMAMAAEAARRLARVHDPEDPDEPRVRVPRRWPSRGCCPDAGSQLLTTRSPLPQRGASGSKAMGTWFAAGHPRGSRETADGVVEVDLVRDGPHALIAGTTGAGKSELLRTLVAAMAASNSPDDLTFVLIDYKGGSTFDASRTCRTRLASSLISTTGSPNAPDQPGGRAPTP